MKTIVKHIISLCIITLLSHNVIAQNVTDFKVNDDLGSTTQSSPRIAVTSDGSFVITWVDRREGTNDIYLQRYESDASPIGFNRKINDDSNSSYQFEPAIAVDLSGLYSIVWKDYRNSVYPLSPDIYFQRFDSSLDLSGVNQNLTIDSPDSTKESPDIDLDQWGRGVIVWADYRNRQWDIYAQIIASDGSLIGSNIKVNRDYSTAQQHSPKVSISNEGWFVVTWYDNRFGDDDIYVQRFDSMGNYIGDNFKVNTNNDGTRQAFPDIACDGAGNFTVVWVDWRNGIYPNNPDIYSKKFDYNLNPITLDKKVNSGTQPTAQKEPTIAADRMGNVSIIWSDSTSTATSWDIVGQMTDVEGNIRESNYRANTFSDSAQLAPDVALDGRKRYLTWVDRRNGNYDIYASVQVYNEPSLVSNPVSLNFIMEADGDLPSSKSLTLEHAGYNPLPFTVSSSVNWLSVTPASGTTPANLSVTINTDTLSSGVYLGSINFVDTQNNDSSLVISVRLDIYQPTMQLSSDTLEFNVFEQIDENFIEGIQVQNSWLGTFDWYVSESIEWLEVLTPAGMDGDSLYLAVNPSGLTAGEYFDSIFVESDNAAGAPDKLILKVNVLSDQPYLDVSPDSIIIFTDDLGASTQEVIINNLGTDLLNWTMSNPVSWLLFDKISGENDDTLVLSFDTLLEYGEYQTEITFISSESFNQSVTVPVYLNYFPRSLDTIKVTSVSVGVGEPGQVAVDANLVNSLNGIYLPLKFDPDHITVDSVLPGISYPERYNFNTVIDNISGRIYLTWTTLDSETVLPAEYLNIGDIYFTAKLAVVTSIIDTVQTGNEYLQIVDSGNNSYMPEFVSGHVTLSPGTDVEEPTDPSLPDKLSLHQNSPNPFNLTTLIKYELPRASQVTLEVYNILGQKVITLFDGFNTAGIHQLEWNGTGENGHVSPTGIYFYRLSLESESIVHKMVLIK